MKPRDLELLLASILGGSVLGGMAYAAFVQTSVSAAETWVIVTAYLAIVFTALASLVYHGTPLKRLPSVVATSRYLWSTAIFLVGLLGLTTSAIAGPLSVMLIGLALLALTRRNHVLQLRAEKTAMAVLGAQLRGLREQFGPAEVAAAARELYAQAELDGGEPVPGYYALLREFYLKEPS